MIFFRTVEISHFRTNLRRLFLASAVLFSCPDGTSAVTGALLVAAGAALHFWASGHLARSKSLTVSGPYALARHPYYASALVIDVGFGLASRNWIGLGVFLPVILAAYLVRARREESDLVARFGEAYAEYRAFSRGMLIPRPWNLFRAPPGGGRSFSFARVMENREVPRIVSHALVLALVLAPLFWVPMWAWAPVPLRLGFLGAAAVVLAAISVRPVRDAREAKES